MKAVHEVACPSNVVYSSVNSAWATGIYFMVVWTAVLVATVSPTWFS